MAEEVRVPWGAADEVNWPHECPFISDGAFIKKGGGIRYMKEYLTSDKAQRGPLLSPSKAAWLSEQGGEENTNQDVLSPGVIGEPLKQPHYQQFSDVTANFDPQQYLVCFRKEF
jgi:hypothetical protein